MLSVAKGDQHFEEVIIFDFEQHCWITIRYSLADYYFMGFICVDGEITRTRKIDRVAIVIDKNHTPKLYDAFKKSKIYLCFK